MRERVLEALKSHEGVWVLKGMAEWLGVTLEELKQVCDELEAEGVLKKVPSLRGVMHREVGNRADVP